MIPPWGDSKTIYDGDDKTVLESSGKFSKGTYYIKVLKYFKIEIKEKNINYIQINQENKSKAIEKSEMN